MRTANQLPFSQLNKKGVIKTDLVLVPLKKGDARGISGARKHSLWVRRASNQEFQELRTS
jgi:hypothetical protein